MPRPPVFLWFLRYVLLFSRVLPRCSCPEQVPGILELSHPDLSKASSKVHHKHHSPGQPSWSHHPPTGPLCHFLKQLYFFIWLYQVSGTSLVAQRLKGLPAMRETRVRSLGREDPLEKEMATHSSILAWRIPWTEEPGGLQSMVSQRVGHDRVTSLTHSLIKS